MLVTKNRNANTQVALIQGVVTRYGTTLIMNKPQWKEDRADVHEHCWTAEKIRLLLAVIHQVRPQMETFYHLALDTDARRVERRGLL
jgi:hypothetical protein